MGKLRFTLIHSLAWAPMISGGAGTHVYWLPVSYAAVFLHIRLWENELMDQSVDPVPVGNPSEPGSQSLSWGCTLPFRLGLGTLPCLPRVFSDHSTCVYVYPLFAQVDEETPMWCPWPPPPEPQAEKQALCPDWTEVEAKTHHLQVLWLPLFLLGFGSTLTQFFPGLSFWGWHCRCVCDQGEDQVCGHQGQALWPMTVSSLWRPENAMSPISRLFGLLGAQ